MRSSRFILWFLLMYQTLFLNVLLPGHTRGAVTTDGKHTADTCACNCCCGGDKPIAAAHSDMPSKRDREHCALCEFAVGLISIPVVRPLLEAMGLLELVPAGRPAVVISLDRISTYFACGPPISSARFFI